MMWRYRIIPLLLVLRVTYTDALFFKVLCRLPLFRLLRFCEEDDDANPSPTSPSNPVFPFPSPVRGPTIGIPVSTNTTTFTPTQQRSTVLQDFKGISNAYSMKKGAIVVDWDEKFLEEYSEISFDVFVAPRDYNFTRVLLNTSVSALTSVFQRNSTLQYFKLTNTTSITVTTPFVGEKHSLFVAAQVGRVYSTNTRYTTVVAAKVSPLIKGGINIVGIFVPTSRLEIKADRVPRGTEHIVSFIGPVAHQHRNLTVGTFFTGFTSQLDPMNKKVLGIIRNEPNGVVLRVVDAELGEIFAELDLDSSFEVSRTGDTNSDRRRLFDIGGFLNDNVIKPIGRGATVAVEFVKDKVFIPIGDAVINTADNVKELITTGGFEDAFKFSIADVDEQWDYVVESPPQAGDTRTSSIAVKGNANVDISLFAKIRVTAVVPVYIKIGAKAEYSMGTTLSISAGQKRKYELVSKELWKGNRYSKWVLVGPVLIELSAQPKLVFEMDASTSLTSSTTTGFTARGGAEIGVVFDIKSNPVGRTEVVPPFNDFDYDFPTFQGTAAFTAGAGIVLKVTVGIYNEMVSADVGLRCGVDLNVAGGVTVVGTNVIPTVNSFDLSIGLGIPITAKFSYLLGKYEITPGSPVWEKKWPIITLPSVDIALEDDHRCRIGTDGAVASFSLKTDTSYPSALVSNGAVGPGDWKFFSPLSGNVWSIIKSEGDVASFEKRVLSSSPEPNGIVTVAIQPKFPPLLKIVKTVSLDSLFPPDPIGCTDPLPCDGGDFFDKLSQALAVEFNSKIFLFQPPVGALAPSTVYKFEDFMQALKKLQTAGPTFKFWLGDDCSAASQKAAFVNMAAFLGQAMRETIIYNACDENNWDLWRADIFKEPTSPPENLAALYPMSSGCGQLGQKYAEYSCDDECPQNLNMDLKATTNAAWIGAPPPLFCGPKSKYDGLGYWNPQQFCAGTSRSCVGQPFSYSGQSAGVHVPVNKDNRFPQFFYTNPLPDRNGVTPNARSTSAMPPTNVEGCCWWGRGVIQTTGRCNFGKLNKQIGADAGSKALYPEINFCTNPQAVCTGPRDLKWVAGIFFWVTEPQSYNRNGFNYIDGIKDFVAKGCAEKNADLNRAECSVLFEYASGIVNRGCHNPGDGGCPNCVPGATCDPAHNVPERVTASKQALQALLKYIK